MQKEHQGFFLFPRLVSFDQTILTERVLQNITCERKFVRCSSSVLGRAAMIHHHLVSLILMRLIFFLLYGHISCLIAVCPTFSWHCSSVAHWPSVTPPWKKRVYWQGKLLTRGGYWLRLVLLGRLYMDFIIGVLTVHWHFSGCCRDTHRTEKCVGRAVKAIHCDV